MEKKIKERFFERFFYAEDGSRDWDRWRKQDPSVVLEFILEELDRAREEGKLEVLEELLEWDTPLEPIGKFMRLQTKMVHMKKDLISKLTTK